jgi:predicted Holliday junction resolvase-like endonuclease
MVQSYEIVTKEECCKTKDNLKIKWGCWPEVSKSRFVLGGPFDEHLIVFFLEIQQGNIG